jgi:hypothetical protein
MKRQLYGTQGIWAFCSAAPGRRLRAPGAPLPACPGTAALRFALCPSLSQSLDLCVGLCRVPLGTKGSWWEVNGNKRILIGTWWKQKEFDGNLMKPKGFWWVIDGNERNLMRIVWELDENKLILMGYWWELFGNWMRTKGYWWVIDENKMNLMGIVWNLIGNQAPTLSKR